MSELGTLFLIVLLIYLVQCLCWGKPGAAVFSLTLRGRGRENRSGFVWSALGTAGFLANPLPPLTPLVVSEWPDFHLDREQIEVSTAKGEIIRLPWEKLKLAQSDTRVFSGEIALFKGNEVQVRACAKLLEEIQRAQASQRESLIRKWLREAVNVQEARHRVAEFARASRWLRVAANLQFIFVFALTPWVLFHFGSGMLVRTLLMMLSISGIIAVDFWPLHKGLYPAAGGARLKAAVTIVLSPVAAIRAADVLARDLLAAFHPLATGGALLAAEDFPRFAGEQLRQLKFDEHAVSWQQKTLIELTEQAIRQHGVKTEELLRPAERDSGCVQYCPRCLAQYLKERDACADCGYEKLVRFEAAVSEPSGIHH